MREPHTRGDEHVAVAVAVRSPEVQARLSAAVAGTGIEIRRSAGSVGEMIGESLEGIAVVLIEAAELAGPERDDIRALSRTEGGRPCLVLTEEAVPKTVRRALAAGAAGVVPMPALQRALEPAIRAVVAGLACFPLEVRASTVKPVLTNREKQILAMVVLGMSNADIARRLHLTESTVKSHLSASYTKLGVRGRNEATQAILDPEDGFGMGILHISGHDGGDPA